MLSRADPMVAVRNLADAMVVQLGDYDCYRIPHYSYEQVSHKAESYTQAFGL